MFEAFLHLIGPFWEIVLVIGSGLAVLVGVHVNGMNKGKKSERAKFQKADRKGAKDARKTAEQSLRDSDGVDADELLDQTNGLRD